MDFWNLMIHACFYDAFSILAFFSTIIVLSLGSANGGALGGGNGPSWPCENWKPLTRADEALRRRTSVTNSVYPVTVWTSYRPGHPSLQKKKNTIPPSSPWNLKLSNPRSRLHFCQNWLTNHNNVSIHPSPPRYFCRRRRPLPAMGLLCHGTKPTQPPPKTTACRMRRTRKWRYILRRHVRSRLC